MHALILRRLKILNCFKPNVNRKVMHILKRLALSIPALMVITSIAFILSKAMPGSSGSFLLDDDLAVGAQADGEAQQRIYKQYLQRTGQDKPLFYFGISSLAEPDTLFKVFPENHRFFLKRLCFIYGNWPFIAAYYSSILEFDAKVKANLQDYDIGLSFVIGKLFDSVSVTEIEKVFHEIHVIAADPSDKTGVRQSLENVHNKFELLLQNEAKNRKLIPVIHWYGTNNQYHAWFLGLLKGDMGNSIRSNRPVLNILRETLGITLVMTTSAFVLGWTIALILGLLINMSPFRTSGPVLMNSLYVLNAVPLFLLSFFLLILFSSNSFQGLLPSFGLGEYQNIDNVFSSYFILLKHLFLPILCMVLVILPYFIGQVDRALKEELKQGYVQTASAKGLSEFLVLKKHVLKNALTPLITIFTDYLPSLISGALVVEVIFAIPGMGRLLVNAVNTRDYPVILGIIITVAIIKVCANILGDVLYSFTDPRIKLPA